MAKLFERKGNTIIMDRTEPRMGICEMCKAEGDLRPYGPNNENICIDCAMKDPEMTAKRCHELMFGSHS